MYIYTYIYITTLYRSVCGKLFIEELLSHIYYCIFYCPLIYPAVSHLVCYLPRTVL